MTKRLISIAIAGLLLVATAWVAFHRSLPNYPYMEMDATEDLSIAFLLNGQKSHVACESTIANLASALLANCPSCRIKKLQCLTELSAEQERQLSSAPLHIASARMVKGVALYTSQNPASALAACQESERQLANSVNGDSRLQCFPPETTRIPAAGNEALAISQFATWQGGAVLIMLGTATVLLFVAWNTGSNAPIPILHRALGQIAKLPRRQKQVVIAASDAVIIPFSLWIAFVLRQEHLVLPDGETVWLFILAPLLAIPVFIRLGLYRAITRYLGVQATMTVFKSVVLYLALFALAVFLLNLKIPRSVLVAHGILTLIFVGATRLIARDFFSKLQLRGRTATNERRNVLIYGAGSAGVQLASALEFSRELRPAAFVDDSPSLNNQMINGLKVHAPELLEDLLLNHSITEVLLAMPSAPRSRRNEIMRLLERFAVSVRSLPGLDELARGSVKIADLRDVGIEDLLGRDPVPVDTALLKRNVTGKAIMVTGAGGSIGAELCHQIMRLQPKRLVLFERNEFSLYSIEKDLLNLSKDTTDEHSFELIPVLGSVTDRHRLERVLTRFKIETVFHAAAYKHVPMVEKNPAEGVYNNIFGTWRAAQAALACNVETFVLISTDKAVRPTNTMGTTKRFAEMILQSLAAHSPEKTRFTMVRFGNVLGSSGSVVPLFREQIRQGGPVTVTDPRITRYFMTIPEAAQLVIQAGAMGNDGDVFVLDMGEPVKILDLAKRMIHLSGMSVRDEDNPDGDIEIIFTGLRPGEKMYEELLIGDNVIETAHPRIRRANEESLPLEAVQDFIRRLEDILERNATDELRAVLMESVKGFSPQCGNEDLLAQ